VKTASLALQHILRIDKTVCVIAGNSTVTTEHMRAGGTARARACVRARARLRDGAAAAVGRCALERVRLLVRREICLQLLLLREQRRVLLRGDLELVLNCAEIAARHVIRDVVHRLLVPRPASLAGRRLVVVRRVGRRVLEDTAKRSEDKRNEE